MDHAQRGEFAMTISVARTISVEIIDRPGAPGIAPVAPPLDRVPSKRFLSRALPGCAIEHLGRPKVLALSSSHDVATSLFFRALGSCFDHHYPFALAPEVLSYLINHEIAETVRRNPDHYRPLYTRDAGTKVIEIRDDTLTPGRPSDWGRALARFEGALRAAVPAGIIDAMLPAFSTWTLESRVAALITFMDAASSFYKFRVSSMCGIPRIRLLGTTDDWRKLCESARKLAEPFAAHLAPFFQQLLPVLTKLAEQADPATEIDNDFWVNIYSRESSSGHDSVTGWITAFVHYDRNPSTGVVKPLGASAGEKRIERNHFALHASTVPFTWEHLGTHLPMRLVAGILGVDSRDGFVTPSLSYAVVRAAEAG
jgi:hypothetical protein